jgi:hypothetical protein
MRHQHRRSFGYRKKGDDLIRRTEIMRLSKSGERNDKERSWRCEH